MLRRVIYTTNSIESLNYQLRKIIKNRGHFPNDDAVIKLLWLAICSIEDKRARDRAKEAGPGGEQLVAQTARWEFDVLPKRSGTQRLQLSVAMRIPLPDRPDERVSAPVLERDIRVTVDPYYSGQQFVAKNWQWLVGAAVGLGGAIGAWLKLFGGD